MHFAACTVFVFPTFSETISETKYSMKNFQQMLCKLGYDPTWVQLLFISGTGFSMAGCIMDTPLQANKLLLAPICAQVWEAIYPFYSLLSVH